MTSPSASGLRRRGDDRPTRSKQSDDAIVVWELRDRSVTGSGAEQLYGVFARGDRPVWRMSSRARAPDAGRAFEGMLQLYGQLERRVDARNRDVRRIIAKAGTPDARRRGSRRVVEANHDITERKRAEEALAGVKRKLRHVIETIPAMVWSTLPDGAVDFLSQRWQEFTGLSSEEVAGMGLGPLGSPRGCQGYIDKWRRSVATGEPFEGEGAFPSRS